MTRPAIRVENLSKRYRIGEMQQREETLVGTLLAAAKRPFSNVSRLRKLSKFGDAGSEDIIWALKDLSFEIQPGEVVGIIGKNGAGKSTLLKILAHITSPTTGRVELAGRTAALLEVGTGFHPELTGRENIYLNGTILGMRKAEVDAKLDEIIDFSGVEKFIDTPIKRYSSGMAVRLAFSVAAHLEPEILLIDEVLAVGDARFQRKCLGKMNAVAEEGRTVLFVSHNMAAVNRLCSRSICLEDGTVKEDGPSESVISKYLAEASESSGGKVWQDSDSAPGDDELRLLRVAVVDKSGNETGTLDIRRSYDLILDYEIPSGLQNVRVNLHLSSPDGTQVLTSSDSLDPDWRDKPRPAGRYRSRCEIPGNFLNTGKYYFGVSADIPFERVILREEAVISVTVEQTGGISGRYPERWPGLICPDLSWRVESASPGPSPHSRHRSRSTG